MINTGLEPTEGLSLFTERRAAPSFLTKAKAVPRSSTRRLTLQRRCLPFDQFQAKEGDSWCAEGPPQAEGCIGPPIRASEVASVVRGVLCRNPASHFPSGLLYGALGQGSPNRASCPCQVSASCLCLPCSITSFDPHPCPPDTEEGEAQKGQVLPLKPLSY